MNGYEVLKYSDRTQRDHDFYALRNSSSSLPEERQAIKFSDVEAVMLSDEEFKLSDKGRVVYRSMFFIAYPKEIHGQRVRA